MNDPIEKAKEIIEEFKHFGPGPHKGTGTPQSVHAGFKKLGGAGVLAAVGGMERTQAHQYVERLRAANPKTRRQVVHRSNAELQGDYDDAKKAYIDAIAKVRSMNTTDPTMASIYRDVARGNLRDIRIIGEEAVHRGLTGQSTLNRRIESLEAMGVW